MFLNHNIILEILEIMPKRQKTRRVGPSVLNIEPYDRNTHLHKIKAWEVSEKSNNDVQGCFENIIGSVITKTVEEESIKYEEDCERRRRQIEEEERDEQDL